jgi:hypothetical protein
MKLTPWFPGAVKYPGRSLFARDGTTSQRIARAIEAALKEKNHE